MTVFCAHFSNPIDNKILAWPHEIGTRAPIREAQFRLLETATGRTSTPYFTAGDFNTPPRGSLYRKLSNRFEDGFATSSFGLGNSFPAFFPVARLDYFWTKEPTRVVACRVLTPRASDHRALVAEITTN